MKIASCVALCALLTLHTIHGFVLRLGPRVPSWYPRPSYIAVGRNRFLKPPTHGADDSNETMLEKLTDAEDRNKVNQVHLYDVREQVPAHASIPFKDNDARPFKMFEVRTRGASHVKLGNSNLLVPDVK